MRNNEVSIGEAVKEFIRKHHLKEKISSTLIKQEWNQLMGDAVMRRTLDLSVRNQCLYVQLNSSALKNELEYSKDIILKKINDSLKEEALKEIRFI